MSKTPCLQVRVQQSPHCPPPHPHPPTAHLRCVTNFHPGGSGQTFPSRPGLFSFNPNASASPTGVRYLQPLATRNGPLLTNALLRPRPSNGRIAPRPQSRRLPARAPADSCSLGRSPHSRPRALLAQGTDHIGLRMKCPRCLHSAAVCMSQAAMNLASFTFIGRLDILLWEEPDPVFCPFFYFEINS